MAVSGTARSLRRTVEVEPRVAFIASVLLAILAVPFLVLTAERPALSLAAAGGLVIVLVCALRVEFALLLLIATTPLEAAFQLSPNPDLSITKLAGVLAFGSFLLHALTERPLLRLDKSHVIVLLLLALGLASSVPARDSPAALTTTLRYASFAALYIVLTQFVGNHALFRRLAWTLSIASAVAAGLAIENFVGGEFFLAKLRYGDANDLAFVLATTLPLTFWLLRERRLLRVPVIAMIGLISCGVLLTFSRGALVGLAAAVAWQIFTERRFVGVLVVGLLVATAVAVAVVRTNSGRVETGFELKQNVAENNVTTRLDAWDAAARLAVDHPVLGVGPGNFTLYYAEATGRPIGSTVLGVVHNAYLDIAAELGILGMLLFFAYLAIVFSRATAARREGLGPPGFAAAVRTSLVVAMVGAITLSEQYFAPFWVLGALATALWAERAIPAAERELAPVPEAPPVPVVAPVAPVTPDYDLDVRERAVEQREQRVNAQFEAIRTQQERLRRRSARIVEHESELAARARDVAELTARAAALAEREVDVARLEAAVTERERAVERERASFAEPAAELDRRAAALEERMRMLERMEEALRAGARAREEHAAEVAARERELAGRERELAERVESLAARQREVERAAERERTVSLLEAALLERSRALDAERSAFAARVDELERRMDAIAARERELDRLSGELAEREGWIAQRERLVGPERAYAPPPAPEPAYAPTTEPVFTEPPPPPVASEPVYAPVEPVYAEPEPEPRAPAPAVPLAGAWNLHELERLVESRGAEYPDRVEEWRSYLFFLRDFAEVDGTVPSSYDSLLWEVFGELTDPIASR